MMTSTTISHKEETALQAYTDVLEDRFGPQLLDVLLFGSKARNEASTGSDVDVAVILLQPTAQDLSEARGLAFDIWLSHGVYLSIRAISQQGWERLGNLGSLFYRNVQRDGISFLSKAA